MKSSPQVCKYFLEEGGFSGSKSTLIIPGYPAEIENAVAHGGTMIPQSRLNAFKLVLEVCFKRACVPAEVHFWWCEVKNRFPDNELPPFRLPMARTKSTPRLLSLDPLVRPNEEQGAENTRRDEQEFRQDMVDDVSDQEVFKGHSEETAWDQVFLEISNDMVEQDAGVNQSGSEMDEDPAEMLEENNAFNFFWAESHFPRLSIM